MRHLTALIMMLLSGLVLQSPAQKLRSNYNLTSARIGLMNGEVLHKAITAFTSDSLAVADTKIAPPGSRVIVHVRKPVKSVLGIVQSFTRDSLYIIQEGTGDTVHLSRMNIKAFKIKKRAKDKGVRIPDLWIQAESIKYIALNSRGGPTVGAVAGFMVGGMAGISIGIDNAMSGTDAWDYLMAPIGSAILGGMIGAGIGSALGSIRREMRVDGDRGKFLTARKTFVLKPKK